MRAKLSRPAPSIENAKIDVEPVFGFLKANLRFSLDFLTRKEGKSKVENEMDSALNGREFKKNSRPNTTVIRGNPHTKIGQKVEFENRSNSTFPHYLSFMSFSILTSQMQYVIFFIIF